MAAAKGHGSLTNNWTGMERWTTLATVTGTAMGPAAAALVGAGCLEQPSRERSSAVSSASRRMCITCIHFNYTSRRWRAKEGSCVHLEIGVGSVGSVGLGALGSDTESVFDVGSVGCVG